MLICSRHFEQYHWTHRGSISGPIVNISALKTPALRTLPRLVLAVLASLGMMVPSAARPCCGCCCSADVSQDDTSTACCSRPPSCCSVAAKPTSLCCPSKARCGGPNCCCYVLPVRAILSEARVDVQKPEASDVHVLSAISARAPAALSLDTAWVHDVGAPHLCGSLRLHSWLCVWLN